MKKNVWLILLVLHAYTATSQSITVSLNGAWQFRQKDSADQNKPNAKWYNAEVPGTVHTDLLSSHLIPDPNFGDNESKVQWVENKTWIYQKRFDLSDAAFNKKNITLVFDGLDTYAAVWLNGTLVLNADNMFRQWTADVKSSIRKKANLLQVVFYPAAAIAKKRKAVERLIYPDNERAFVRKAQYQFGWDWGPRLVTCGMWKDVRIIAGETISNGAAPADLSGGIRLVTQKDSIGESFYFTVHGKPVFSKGANWIPLDNFIPRAVKLKRYALLLSAAKEAGINMLRVWGGGIYEDDIFYDLCDQYGIMVWQDFMFAGALYPADSAFLKNVEEEVRYQVSRLRHHRCIALWCGNNEIEEAWNNWGWQQEFKYAAGDSAMLWNNYKKIFHELIPGILKSLDPQRPYWPSSPETGWGRDSAYKKGDVHYWGVWWGREGVEKYKEKLGRFHSEYGMQGMPDLKTIAQFAPAKEQDTTSQSMRTHQKHPFGYQNIKWYIDQKFRAPARFEDLVYVSQLMQADAIKTAIEAHRGNRPVTMGTMFWQWNDCWPVSSWSAVDYYGRKKALFFETKRDYRDVVILPSVDSNYYLIKVVSDLDTAIEVSLETDFVSFGDTLKNTLRSTTRFEIKPHGSFMGRSRRDPAKEFPADGVMRFRLLSHGKKIAENYLFLLPPKKLNLRKVNISWSLTGEGIELQSNKLAYGVYIDVPDGVKLEDNYFHLFPNEKKFVKFTSAIPLDILKKSIKIKSLTDTFLP